MKRRSKDSGVIGAKAITGTGAVRQTLIRTNARSDARGKPAATENVVHDRQRVEIRVVAHRANMAQGSRVPGSRQVCARYKHRLLFHRASSAQPAPASLLTGQPFIAASSFASISLVLKSPEIAKMKSTRLIVFLMKRDHVFASDTFNRRLWSVCRAEK